MNLLLPIFFSLMFPARPIDSGYAITYKHEIHKVGEEVERPKVAVPAEFRAVIGKDSLEISELIRWPLTLTVEMFVDPEGNYTIHETSEDQSISLGGGSGTRYYTNGRYYSGTDTTSLKAYDILFKPQKESKIILGYTCQKFIATEKETNKTYEVWATKELPATITGMHRWPRWTHAILEIREMNGLWTRTAVNIRKMEY